MLSHIYKRTCTISICCSSIQSAPLVDSTVSNKFENESAHERTIVASYLPEVVGGVNIPSSHPSDTVDASSTITATSRLLIYFSNFNLISQTLHVLFYLFHFNQNCLYMPRCQLASMRHLPANLPAKTAVMEMATATLLHLFQNLGNGRIFILLSTMVVPSNMVFCLEAWLSDPFEKVRNV